MTDEIERAREVCLMAERHAPHSQVWFDHRRTRLDLLDATWREALAVIDAAEIVERRPFGEMKLREALAAWRAAVRKWEER